MSHASAQLIFLRLIQRNYARAIGTSILQICAASAFGRAKSD
jgi:hypothetical protein